MIWADWLLLAALLVSIVIGVLRGFTREFFGLVSWVVAIVGAVFLAPTAYGWLESAVSTPSLRIAASYASVFFGFLVVGAIVTAVVSSLVQKSGLTGVDRTIGGGFGLIRGVLITMPPSSRHAVAGCDRDPLWRYQVSSISSSLSSSPISTSIFRLTSSGMRTVM